MGALWDTGEVTKIITCLQDADHRGNSLTTFRAVSSMVGDSKEVAVKTVSGRRLANEVAAAWVAGKIGLTYVPRPMLLTDGTGQLASKGGGTPNGLWFATEFCDLPFFEFPDFNDLCEVVNTPAFGEVTVFDTLIANIDRVNRNLLWKKDSTRIFVFDHDKAFGGEWTPTLLPSIAATFSWQGMLETNLMHAGQDARDRMLDLAAQWSATSLGSSVDELDELVTAGIIPQPDVDALKFFIVTRAANLVPLVSEMLERA